MSAADVVAAADATASSAFGAVPAWIVLSAFAIVLWGAQSFLLKAASASFGIPSARSHLIVTAVTTALVAASNADARWSEFESLSRIGILITIITGCMSFSGTYAYLRAMEAPGAQASVVTSLCGLYPCVTLVLCVACGYETITTKKLLGLFFALVSGYMFTSE